MTEPTPSWVDLLELATEVARGTAGMIRERRRGGVSVQSTKSSPIDIVTEVDTAAEQMIFEALMAARPDDGFLGEEGASAESSSGVVWVVDPIDGTVNFLYGIPQYAVSVAATIEGRSVAGVVLDIAGGECFTAVLGEGSWCDGRRLRVADPVPRSQWLVGTGFNYVAEVRAKQGVAAARLLPQVRDLRRLGSSALDLCALADGRLDAYVEEGLNPWDIAAGSLVATEAGAVVELHPGIGGNSCAVCAPDGSFADVLALVRDCGFLGE